MNVVQCPLGQDKGRAVTGLFMKATVKMLGVTSSFQMPSSACHYHQIKRRKLPRDILIS
jgi:hypothetical protein